ncbi:MAG: ABC transporter ATP-binding protein [Clostridiales bacterium]|jgi:putative ABC transport system ATP-binding protein|nr:ABC transporter ATP-binding protein [Clostridiales bacterium]
MDAPVTVVDLKNVRKVYKMGEERIVALDNVSLTFEKGRIYCLLGTSGSGKSTLLNVMAGLEPPTSGNIRFHSGFIHKMSEKELALFRQKYIGFVFQQYNLLPTLTALENVMLPLIFKNVSRGARRKKAMEMLRAVGLSNRHKHKPSQLSGGQQQRVSIARAFVNNPEIVFCDEPTGNLDTKTTVEMMDLITGMARKYNQTLIIVTHNTELVSYADMLIRIRDGKVEEVSEASVYKDDPVYNISHAEENVLPGSINGGSPS